MTFKMLLRVGKRELQTVKYIDTTFLWVEFFRLLGYYVAWDGFKPTFRNTIWKGTDLKETDVFGLPVSPIFKS